MGKKLIFLISFLLTLSFLSYAQVPQMINYQGMLSDAGGNPLSGDYSVVFKIYSAEVGGTVLWSETQTVTVTDGLFDVLLGSATAVPYSVFDGADKYLALKIGSDSEMTPRKKLVSVGYSLHAYNSDKFGGKDTSDFMFKLSGVSPDNGSIDLIAGDNVTITPDAANHNITIAATAGAGGDNLGNHTATENIKLNGHGISDDGDNEGVFIREDGTVLIGNKDENHGIAIDGLTIMQWQENALIGRIWLGDPVEIIGNLSVDYTLHTSSFEMPTDAADGYVLTSDANGFGTWQPVSASGDNLGNHTATQNVKLNGHWLSGDGANEGIFVKNNGTVGIGTSDPAGMLGVEGNIKSSGTIRAEWSLISEKGYIIVGNSNTSHGNGDIIASDDLMADDDVIAKGRIETNGFKMATGASNGYVLTSDANGVGTWQAGGGSGDNLGNHTATQNIKLNGHWLSNDGGNEGVFVKSNGNVGIGDSSPSYKLSVDGGADFDGDVYAKNE
ncbi:MAG: hypothetical protein GXO75_20710, partial [Calditrichaeota bacterium]|nr:hypothetical protein [Calditrichota bacterium]